MVGLLIGFALLGCTLAWALIGGGRHVVLKTVLTIALAGWGFVVWHAFDSYGGWATRAEMPSSCLFDWGLVEEPDQTSGDPGRIFIWCTPIHSSGSFTASVKIAHAVKIGDPRAYELPYSRQLHEQINKAVAAVRHGVPVKVTKRKKHKKGGRGTGGQSFGTGRFQFSALPPAREQPKTP